MAQKVSITLIDDLDGSEATQTVSFGLDGSNYEIDLNDSNASALREELAAYVENARKVSGGPRRGRTSKQTSANTDTKLVRDWAISQGLEVSARGRVSADIRSAYDAAH